jgi:hypothetical protein
MSKLLILLIFSIVGIYGQNYSVYLDSAKMIYGSPCTVGVNSPLIDSLQKYQDNIEVSIYLSDYFRINSAIENFRKSILNKINTEPALLLNLNNLLEPADVNIINAMGVYFGTDNISNLIVSHTILRNSIANFHQPVIQFLNFDDDLKTELINYGTAWYHSSKLKNLPNAPID